MTKNLITGLDIGTNWIRLVVCEQKNGDSVPQVLALVKRQSKGLRRGYVINLEETTQSIREALDDAERIVRSRIRKVIVGVGGLSLGSKTAEGGVVASRPDSEITESDLGRAVEASEAALTDMANKQILHRIPLSFKLDGEKVLGRPEGLRGSKLEVKTLFITGGTQHLRDMVRAAEEAGLIVEDLVASPFAASLAVMTKVQKMAGCVLVNIGSQTTSIAVFEEGLPLSIQVFAIGSTDITNDIALGFKIPIEEAEKVKKGEGEPVGTKKKLDEIIEARLSDIFEFIEMHLKKIKRSGLLPAGLIITGGGASIANIEELAKDYFRLPAKTAQTAIATNSKSQIRDSAWSVSFGLCLFGVVEQEGNSFGARVTLKNTQKKILAWLKEFMP
ncbi:MAG TPA: cell division protein FtsA [Candidatus Paceibacterota bacterium]|jgi:cell division protein FtsA|nr:cell division protein FtsA [Candidatus Paceibacterota bacterium]HOH11302.1 cell division protein FtsA [Candidatus Paceibacterota bacterium]HOY11102.1 cell division protein FtsA [Candidatus Paceibacterota bacterium]HPB60391.1 cell division protein FtsA [Candidatus Paceibacterota bacterium]HPI24794.1 cell division protein FtsA [Candidatus Paceibacterota bacterium]